VSLTKKHANYIHLSAAAVEARNRKFFSHNLVQAGREHAGPFCWITGVCVRLRSPTKILNHEEKCVSEVFLDVGF
jgi:hypothetical protein